MNSLEYYWYRPNKIVWLLLPLSWLYCLLTLLRRKLYQLNVKKSYAAGVPVVVVGNIVAGGSGKTPLLIALCEFVQTLGYSAGVVSRGYGGTLTGVKQVEINDDAALVGDEPLMISQRTGTPVVVGADRVAAINYLLANNKCDIIFSDDGLQHYRMRRDLEFSVVDAERGFGNGFCLPAGPLREKISRLQDVDLIIYNGSNNHARYKHTNRKQSSSHQAKIKYSYQLKIVKIQRLNSDECSDIASFSGKTVHAVAGIGNPHRFFRQLESHGLTVTSHAFSDHHHYQQEDFSACSAACILMTEKDAVKCRHLVLTDAWVVHVESELSANLKSRLDVLFATLLQKYSLLNKR